MNRPTEPLDGAHALRRAAEWSKGIEESTWDHMRADEILAAYENHIDGCDIERVLSDKIEWRLDDVCVRVMTLTDGAPFVEDVGPLWQTTLRGVRR